MICGFMLLYNWLDYSHKVLNVFRITLRNLSSGRNKAIWYIMDIFKLALEFGIKIEADWAGCHFLKWILLVC